MADWTAGYEAGWTAGYRAAMTVLDEAGAFLAATLQPVRRARRHPARRPAQARPAPTGRRPRDVAERRRRTYASWGLTPPDDTATATSTDERETPR